MPPELHEAADPLTVYAVRFRYPFFGDLPSAPEAQEAFAVARRVHEFVRGRIPPEAHAPPSGA